MIALKEGLPVQNNSSAMSRRAGEFRTGSPECCTLTVQLTSTTDASTAGGNRASGVRDQRQCLNLYIRIDAIELLRWLLLNRRREWSVCSVRFDLFMNGIPEQAIKL